MLVGARSGTWLESNLFALWFDVQLRSRHLNFIAFLTHAFIANIVALILILFFVLLYLQVPVNKSRCELVFGNCCREQLGDSSAQKWFFKDLSHGWSLSWILN